MSRALGFVAAGVLSLALLPSTAAASEEDPLGLAGAFSRLDTGVSLGALFAEAAPADRVAPVADSGAAPAERPRSTSVELSVAAGWHFGGDIEVNTGLATISNDLDGGAIGKVMLDCFPVKFLGIGLYAQAAGTDIEDAAGAEITDCALLEAGAELKLRIPLADWLFVTPGVQCGYRQIRVEDNPADSQGIALNAGVDVRVKIGAIEVFVEPGFIYQPLGWAIEDGDIEITFDPMFYVMGGLGLAF